MNLTEEQLLQLEELAELQFSHFECALILQVDPELFTQAIQKEITLKNTYERGRLKASAAVRKAILQQAKQGSTPAQKQMLELIKNVSTSASSAYRTEAREQKPPVPFDEILRGFPEE